MTQRVEKLDNPKIFDEIKTGLKTTAGIKAYELAKYNSLFQQFRALSMFGLTAADKGQLAWVGDHWHAIVEYVSSSKVRAVYSARLPRGHRKHSFKHRQNQVQKQCSASIQHRIINAAGHR